MFVSRSISQVPLSRQGRFARDRASGFGCSYSASQKLVQKYAKQNDSSREEMFQDTDPKTKSRLKGMLPSYHFQNSDANKNDQNVNAVYAKVPPPDYYLGETPGTQIWGRLRLAGLETERIFDLDTKRVILKIKCPEDRLMDVAEVLELELKTRNGEYNTFWLYLHNVETINRLICSEFCFRIFQEILQHSKKVQGISLLGLEV